MNSLLYFILGVRVQGRLGFGVIPSGALGLLAQCSGVAPSSEGDRAVLEIQTRPPVCKTCAQFF